VDASGGRKPTALNVDGLDRKRRKWNFWAVVSAFLRASFYLHADASCDGRRAIQDIIGNGRQEVRMIATEPSRQHRNHFASFGCPAGGTSVYRKTRTGNNPELVLSAYRDLRTDWPLVMWAQSLPADMFASSNLLPIGAHFHRPSTGRILSLQKNAGVFVFAGRLEGFIRHWLRRWRLEMQFFISTPRQTGDARDYAFHFIQRKETWREAGTIDWRSQSH